MYTYKDLGCYPLLAGNEGVYRDRCKLSLRFQIWGRASGCQGLGIQVMHLEPGV